MFDAILSAAIVALEAVGAAIIAMTGGAALFLVADSLIRYRRLSWLAARRMLGRGLVLALDFLIGADILRTMVAPSFGEVGVLAAIIGLRIILSLTIEFELRYMPGNPEDEGP